jgi:hypothetical protein
LHKFYIPFKALSLGSHKQFQPAIMDSLKSATQRAIALRRKREETCWLRSISTSMQDVGDVFKNIIEQTTRHGGWDLVGQGEERKFGCFSQ